MERGPWKEERGKPGRLRGIVTPMLPVHGSTQKASSTPLVEVAVPTHTDWETED